MNDYLNVAQQPGEQLKARPWCRYWARTVDYGLYSWFVGVVTFISVFVVVFMGAMLTKDAPSPTVWVFIILGFVVFIILLMVISFFLEAFFISRWGATPGKWLFKTRVTHADGSLLTYGEALIRSVQVLFFGMGLCVPFVSLVAHIWACIKLMDTGTTRWDEVRHYKVATGDVGVFRYIIGICIALSYTFFSTLLQVISKLAQYSSQ